MAGVVIGQPLDTIKVRLQTMPDVYRNGLQCGRSILALEGPRAFFNGMMTPLLGQGGFNAIAFGVYGSFDRALKGFGLENEYLRTFSAGSIAGAAQTSISSPSELIKCRLQHQQGATGTVAGAKYTGMRDCAQQIFKSGGVSALFRGLPVTILRDGGSFGIYFLVYRVLCDALMPQMPTVVAQFTAGGVAGALSWMSCYPADVVKSRIQLAADNAPAASVRMWDVAKHIYRTEGAKAFTRGLTVCTIRAVPNNGVVFVVYEACLVQLGV